MSKAIDPTCIDCENAMCDQCDPKNRIDLFTRDEVQRAKTIMRDGPTPHARILDEIVTDEVMQRINRDTGQENDRRYMAYRLEYVAGGEP